MKILKTDEKHKQGDDTRLTIVIPINYKIKLNLIQPLPVLNSKNTMDSESEDCEWSDDADSCEPLSQALHVDAEEATLIFPTWHIHTNIYTCILRITLLPESLTIEHRHCLGLSGANAVVMELSFFDRYLEHCPSVCIGRTTHNSQPEPFLLSHPLTIRLNEWLGSKHWPLIQQSNFVVEVGLFLNEAILEAHKRCLSCGCSLQYYGIKPSVCTEEICMFRFEALGLGFSLEDEIMIRPYITDLLISFCDIAAAQDRLRLFFPNTVCGIKTNEDVLECLSYCPSIAVMQEWIREGILRLQLKQRHKCLIPLLFWILTSNKSHIRALADEERLPEFEGVSHQFALLSSSPEREIRFQRLVQSLQKTKKDSGYLFAFHGSWSGNWHCIVRNGLRNMSGTSEQLNGAVYGHGIYMAPNSLTALKYCKSSKSKSTSKWSQECSVFGNQWRCLAVCQVAKLTDLGKPDPYYVIKNEDAIITRVLLLVTPHDKLSPAGVERIKTPAVLRQR